MAQAETTEASGPRPAREILSWELFGTASRALATQIAADGYRPEVVLAIARGGLLPAGALAYALDLKNVATVNVEFYTGVDQRLPVPVMLPPVPEAVDLAGARVLIVDDVADTGRTLEVVQRFAGAHVAESRTAVLYEKPHSVVRCEYVWRRTDRWINFPWSTLPPVVRNDGTVLDA